MRSSHSRVIKAVILDRDGTINRDSNAKSRIFRKEDLEFLAGAITAIRRLNVAGFKVIVATNQAAIGKGLCTERDVRAFHAHMNRLMRARGAHINRFYYCPHHPDAIRPKYRRVCKCRKPEPGLLKQAIRDFRVDVRRSFMIGDSAKDVEAGTRVGLRTILLSPAPAVRIKTRNSLNPKSKIQNPKSKIGYPPTHTAPDLLAAVRFVIKNH